MPIQSTISVAVFSQDLTIFLKPLYLKFQTVIFRINSFFPSLENIFKCNLVQKITLFDSYEFIFIIMVEIALCYNMSYLD